MTDGWPERECAAFDKALDDFGELQQRVYDATKEPLGDEAAQRLAGDLGSALWRCMDAKTRKDEAVVQAIARTVQNAG